MRVFFLISLFLALFTNAKAQFYQLFGQEEINLCEQSEVSLFIETSVDIQRTDWEIIPESSGAFFFSTELTSAGVYFTAPGTYLIIATSTNPNNQVFSDSIYINVFGIQGTVEVLTCGKIDSASGCYEVCAFSETIITSSGAGTFELIEISGESSYEDHSGYVRIIWGEGGYGSVTVVLEGTTGCPQEICFDILPLPVAQFSTDPPATNDTITVCKNQEIQFENQSLNGFDYVWQFGDGESVNTFHASHAYETEGIYTVALAVNSICECSDEETIVVEVLPAPTPTLDCVNSVCPGDRQRYTATATGCTDFQWQVSSNGTIVNGGEPGDDFVEVIWNEGPDGFIDLTVGGCSTAYCSYTNRFRIPVISPDGPIEGDEAVCSGEIVTYSAPYFPGTEYFWTVGNYGTIMGDQTRSSVSVRWDEVFVASSSTVSVVYNNCFLECGGEDQINVTIVPNFRISGDVQVCQGHMADVSATSGFGPQSSAYVDWSLVNSEGVEVATGPSNTNLWSFAFNVPPGNYEWVAKNSSAAYCNEEVRLTIQVTPIPSDPIAILGEQTICPGVTYGYTIQTVGSYLTQWIVTDGANLFAYNGQSIQHTFGNAAPHQIIAFNTDIQNSNCVSNSITLQLQLADDVSITGPDEVCFNQIETYTATYITGVDYTWEVIPADHGEIKRSDVNEVDIFFSQSGPVTLRVTACGVVEDLAILVNPLPAIVVPGPLTACSNEQVSVNTNYAGLPHVWNNESGASIGVTDAIMLYPGSYSVEVTDGNGCMNEQAFQITTNPAPEVNISTPFPTNYCATLPGGVNIYANTDGVDYSFEWFKDNVSLGVGGPVWNVNDFGAYHVEVTNQYGCKGVSGIIQFGNCCPPNDCGIGVPGLPSGCLVLDHDFNISKNEVECDEHIYSFDPAEIVPGTSIWLLGSASDGLITVQSGDIFNYPHTKPGYYYLIAYAELAGFPYVPGTCGHLEEMIDTIKAVADYTFTGKCENVPIEFEDLTTFLPGEAISTWSWDFGDPASGVNNTSSLQHPSHVFANGGTYTVTLQVALVSGCITTKQIQIEISNGPAILPVYDPLYCEDEAMAMYGGQNLFNVQWNFGDPGSGSENTAVEDSVFHTFSTSGNYVVGIQAEDVHGCPGQSTINIEIVPNTLAGTISIVPPSICFGDSATLTAPAGGVNWAWSTGETTEQIISKESQQFNVLITDQYHCTYSPPAVFLEVLPDPVVVIRAREILANGNYGPWSDSLSLCAGSEFEIQAFSSTNVSYLWTHGPTGNKLVFTDEGGNLLMPGDYTFSVIATDIVNGCLSDTTSIYIDIIALPSTPVISLTSGNGCSLQPNTLTVSNPQAGIDYVWSDGQEGVSITVTQAGIYYVTALNSEGCSARSNELIINPSANVDQIPGGCYLLCDPAEVCIPYLADAASYIVYHNGNVFQSGNGSPANLILTDDGTYEIEVTSLNGCVAISDPLDIQLYPGVGSITVEVWLDQNGDGVGDVQLPNITVVVESSNGLHTGKTETIQPGHFVFTDLPSSEYTAYFDPVNFPSTYKRVTDSVLVDLVLCDDSLVAVLVLEENCTVTGVDVMYTICSGEEVTLGDSVWNQIGTYEMHMPSVSGCDSVFQVIISETDSIDLNAQVWFDVDHSGTITPADTLLDGVEIDITGLTTGSYSTYLSSSASTSMGLFERDEFFITIDTFNLAGNYSPVLFETTVSDTSCGSALVEFLVESSCQAVSVIEFNSICSGDSILINGQWYFEDEIVFYSISDPVTFCDSLFEIHVTTLEGPDVSGVVDWNCVLFGSIDLSISGNPPFSVSWNNGLPAEEDVSGLQPGEYIATVIDSVGCSTQDTFTISDTGNLLSFHIEPSYIVQEGDSVLMEITGDVNTPGLQYQWIPATILSCDTCQSTYATPTGVTTVQITITDEDSCTYILTTIIEVIPTDDIFAPNVFTPNNDGINDVWKLSTKLETGNIHTLEIFDRWGNMVYKTDETPLNQLTGWDGKNKGKESQTGVYVYVAKVTLGDGRDVTLKGDITLVR